MRKALPPLATLMAALFFGAVLPLLPGCAGGCGEDNSSKGSTQGSGAPGGTTPQHGSGSASLDGNRKDSRYDSAGKSSGTALSQAGEVAAQLEAPVKPEGPVKAVSPQDFRAAILRPGTTVFLTVVRTPCEDCDAILPVITSLAPQFKGRFKFHSFDGAAVGAGGLLPPQLSLEPLPAFVMYKDGKPTSWLQGLPFAREVDAKGAYTEPLEGYQRRLQRWFHDALTQKDLNFSRTLSKPPKKKT